MNIYGNTLIILFKKPFLRECSIVLGFMMQSIVGSLGIANFTDKFT